MLEDGDAFNEDDGIDYNSSHRYLSRTTMLLRLHEEGLGLLSAPARWPLYAQAAQLAANPATP